MYVHNVTAVPSGIIKDELSTSSSFMQLPKVCSFQKVKANFTITVRQQGSEEVTAVIGPKHYPMGDTYYVQEEIGTVLGKRKQSFLSFSSRHALLNIVTCDTVALS